MKARSQSSSIPKKHSESRKKNRETAEVWTVGRAVAELERHGKKRNITGMAYFGIRAKKSFGVSTPTLYSIARKIRRNHELALKLWETEILDARILAVMLSDPERVSAGQMERWVRDFDSWGVCDAACCHLFVDAKHAWSKAYAWSNRKKEYEKRAAFALVAALAVHDKEAGDAKFSDYLKVIERESGDERNFVRKAVNWALRNIGKRNRSLNRDAIRAAERIRLTGTRAGRWIAADALRELRSEAVQKRLLRKENVLR